MGLIEVSNLFFSYPTKKNVLNGISLNCSNDELTELGLKIADSSIGYSEILEFIYKFK